MTGLLKLAPCVLTTTDLTKLCLSGSVWTTRPNGQTLRRDGSSLRPGFALGAAIYFSLAMSEDTLSAICSKRDWLNTALFAIDGANTSHFPVDLELIWLGVNGSRLSGSPDTNVSSLEFMIASTSHIMFGRILHPGDQYVLPLDQLRSTHTLYLPLPYAAHMAAASWVVHGQSIPSFRSLALISS